MGILDQSKKSNDPVIVEYNGTPEDLGSPGSVSYGSTSVAGVAANVDILRRQYIDSAAALFASLELRQMGFFLDTGTGKAILIWKDASGVRHDYTEVEAIWEIVGGILKPITSNPTELPDDLTITGIATVTQDPVLGVDLVRLSYLQANYYDKTTSDGKYALIGALDDYVATLGVGFLANADTVGTKAFQGDNLALNMPESYCTILNIHGGSDSRQFQIASHYGNFDRFYFRHKHDSFDTWRPWKQIALTEDLDTKVDKDITTQQTMASGLVIGDDSEVDGELLVREDLDVLGALDVLGGISTNGNIFADGLTNTFTGDAWVKGKLDTDGIVHAGLSHGTATPLRSYGNGSNSSLIGIYNNSDVQMGYIGFAGTNDFRIQNLISGGKIVLNGDSRLNGKIYTPQMVNRPGGVNAVGDIELGDDGILYLK
jgi:hypothetical protein